MNYLSSCSILMLLLPFAALGQRVTESFISEGNTIFSGVSMASKDDGELLLLIQDDDGQRTLRVDKDGKGVWSFDLQNMGQAMRALDVGQKGWLLFGSSRSPDNNSADYEIHLMDDNGSVDWSVAFGSGRDETPIDAFLLPGNRIILTGNSQDGLGGNALESMIISLNDGSVLRRRSFITQESMIANDAALVGDRIFFWGSNASSTGIVTPYLSAIDTTFSLFRITTFPDQVSMTGQVMTLDEAGIPVLVMGRNNAQNEIIAFPIDFSQDPTSIQAKHLSYPASQFRASELLATKDGYLLGGSLTDNFPVGAAYIAVLDKNLNTVSAFIDTSIGRPGLDGMAQLGADRFVMARNVDLQELGNGAPKPGVSFKEISASASSNCPTLSFTFQDKDSTVRLIGGGLQSFVNDAYITRNVSVTSSITLFIRESSCGPLNTAADFTRSDSVICFGDSISLIDNSTDATNLRWFFTNTQLDSFIGRTPPTLLPTRAGEISITQIAAGSGAPDTLTKVVKVIRAPYLQLPADTVICLGDTLMLEAKGFIEDQYSWSPAEAVSPSSSRLTSFHPQRLTTIKVEVSNQGLCLISDSFLMDVIPNLSLETSQNIDSICPADTAQLRVQPGPYAIRWSTGDTTELIKVADAGAYKVSIANQCFSQEAELRVFESETCPGQLFIPNAFSPNSDGHNDTWRPGLQFVANMEIWIYSRWGQLVYYENSDNPEWDGRVLENQAIAGQYFFKAKATMLGGNKENLKGKIVLIR